MQNFIDTYYALLAPAITIGWDISYLELILIVFNLSGVYLAAKNNVLTAPVCIVAIMAYMMLCISNNFYSEFLLQIYFLLTNIWLWYAWSSNTPTESKPRYLNAKSFTICVAFVLMGSFVLGANIDLIFSTFAIYITAFIALFIDVPLYTHIPASFPYVDAFTTVTQITAMFLMVKRYVESWWLWILIDVVSIPMFALKGGYGVSIMFMLFLVPAIYGAIKWQRLAK